MCYWESLVKSRMQWVLAHDQGAASKRSDEPLYLANTLMAGGSIQARAFTGRESMEVVVAGVR